MCGITGYIDFGKRTSEKVLGQMIDSIKHRGPDGRGQEIAETQEAQIGLGHARLSIIDLSENGRQPMHFEDYSITYNGEIYNFQEIRTTLKELGHEFQSESDTEVILHSYQEWGKDCVNRFIGMFAFVLYDRKQKKILLCRDRAGVKPLFYYFRDGLFMFSSELKAFHRHPNFVKEINPQAVYLFMQYGYVPGSFSIFEKTYKLEPGSWLELNLTNQDVGLDKYWDAQDYYEKPILDIDYDTAKKETEKILTSASNYRMVADVPVGIFLSGGFDSTIITALIQKERTEKLKTFTIGFPDGVNEAPHAEKVADLLGTNHTTYNCTFEDAKAIIPNLTFYYDEPNADISCIPTILVSQLARQEVTVALSADGGDELFAGYNGYAQNLKRLQKMDSVPSKMQPFLSHSLKMGSTLMKAVDARTEHKLGSLAETFELSGGARVAKFCEKIQQYPSGYIKKLLLNSKETYHPIFHKDYSSIDDMLRATQLIDFKGSMSDLLLVKVDRATMSASLEGREPLLDHRILEFAAQLPSEYKYDGVHLKKILKDITYQYVPQKIMDKPKTGFDLPIYDWLKKDLSYLIEENLNPESIIKSNTFNPAYVKSIIKDFYSGKLRYVSTLWRIIIFQMWYKTWMD